MRSASFLKKKWPINRTPVLSVQLQIDFFHRVSHILEKGYPLLEALSMTGWDARLKPVSHELIEVLKGGDTISLALEKAVFPIPSPSTLPSASIRMTCQKRSSSAANSSS